MWCIVCTGWCISISNPFPVTYRVIDSLCWNPEVYYCSSTVTSVDPCYDIYWLIQWSLTVNTDMASDMYTISCIIHKYFQEKQNECCEYVSYRVPVHTVRLLYTNVQVIIKWWTMNVHVQSATESTCTWIKSCAVQYYCISTTIWLQPCSIYIIHTVGNPNLKEITQYNTHMYRSIRIVSCDFVMLSYHPRLTYVDYRYDIQYPHRYANSIQSLISFIMLF